MKGQMQFIIIPHKHADIQECLNIGIRDFFVDFEVPASGDAIPPNQYEDVQKLRIIDPTVRIHIRPDDKALKNERYLQSMLALHPECVFIPNAEDLDEIEYWANLFAKQNADFICMVESQEGLDNLPNMLSLENVTGAYMGLHDFSKSLEHESTYIPVQMGYLDEISHYAHNSNKRFGFTTLSQTFTDSMIAHLIKEHARLGSNIALAPASRTKNFGTSNSLGVALTQLSALYRSSFNPSTDLANDHSFDL